MNLAFDIAGHTCVAHSVTMRGRSLEASFETDAVGPLLEAYVNGKAVAFLGVAGMPVVYSVETFANDNNAGCTAVFSVHGLGTGAVH